MTVATLTPSPDLPRKAERWRSAIHYICTGILAVAMIPLLYFLHLRLPAGWSSALALYWVSIPFQSLVLAIILYMVQFSPRETALPLVRRYWNNKGRIFLLAPLLVGLFWLDTWPMALCWVAVALAALEMGDRLREQHRTWTELLKTILWPMAYLFVGLLVMVSYNDIIASTRFYAAYDPVFDHLDKLLFGITIPTLVPYLLNVMPGWVFRSAEFIYYYGMFAQAGAAICFLAIARGRKRALAFVGALLIAYYLTLLIYFLWPNAGPFYFYQAHHFHVQAASATRRIQRGIIDRSQTLWERLPSEHLGFDYFIGFPSMHVGIPIVALAYLRRWRRAAWFLVALDVLLIVSILLLGWHYFVDLLGGAVVGLLAVAIAGGWSKAAQDPVVSAG